MSAYDGQCFCGAVRFKVSGEPAAMGFCHCESCRTWTAGAERIGSYAKTPRSLRKWCTACGGHLFTEHPHWKLTDVYAALLPADAFKPGVHVNYQETRLHLHDG